VILWQKRRFIPSLSQRVFLPKQIKKEESSALKAAASSSEVLAGSPYLFCSPAMCTGMVNTAHFAGILLSITFYLNKFLF